MSAIKHIGMLTLSDDVKADHRTAIANGLQGLVGVVPGLLRMSVAADLGIQSGNATILFMATFEDEQAWAGYGAHSAHREVVKKLIAPVLRDKAFMQIEGDLADL